MKNTINIKIYIITTIKQHILGPQNMSYDI